MSARLSFRHVILIIAATACWGGGTVLSKQVLERGVAPLTLLVIELAASCLLLLGSMIVLRTAWSRGPALGKLAMLGILNPGLAYALGLLGLATVSASMAVLLWGTEPVLILVLAMLLLRERVAAATGLGIVAALVGVLLVIYRPGAGGDPIGLALTAAAVTACACYTVLTRRWLLDDSSLLVALVQQAVALAFAVVVAGGSSLLGLVDLSPPVGVGTWLLAAASGAVYYGLAFWFYVSGLRGVPASVAGAFLPLIPVFGLAAAYLVGDRLVDRQLLGAGLVILATATVAVRHLTRGSGSGEERPADARTVDIDPTAFNTDGGGAAH